MDEAVGRAIQDAEFEFLNSRARVQATCDYEAIRLPGLVLGPFKEGERYTMPLWAALELARKGIVSFIEPPELDSEELMKVHTRETRLAAGLAEELPEDFYPRLRRLLSKLEHEARRDPSKLVELRRWEGMAKDIVNARLKKIVSTASSMAKSSRVKRYLTPEEQVVFDLVGRIADTWRKEVVNYGRS